MDGSAFLRHRFIRVAFLQDWKGVVPGGHHDEVFRDIEERLNDVARRDGEFAVSVPIDYIAARPSIEVPQNAH
ncbi:MAG: hypothetical protein H0U92_03170 [Actinobacteria bacterium]|nr:hypothetical protein [Actinomycetota bacterium]